MVKDMVEKKIREFNEKENYAIMLYLETGRETTLISPVGDRHIVRNGKVEVYKNVSQPTT